MIYDRIVWVLAAGFAVGLVTAIWYVSRLQSTLVQSMALESAALYTQALAEFRTLYTSEVVERVRPLGIEVTHDYRERPGAIPLPAKSSSLPVARVDGRSER